MKTRILPSLSLLLILLAACAPAAAVTEAAVGQPNAQVAVAPTTTPFQPADSNSNPGDVATVPTEAAASAPLPVATSRGPNLEATDPSGVNLASGNLQLVEFFRFT